MMDRNREIFKVADTQMQELLKYELREDFVPAYVNRYSGKGEIINEGVALFFKAGTVEPKTITIFVYHKELKEVTIVEKVDSVRFRAGRYLFSDTIGRGGDFMEGTNSYPDADIVVFACFTPVDNIGQVTFYDVYFCTNQCNNYCNLSEIYWKNNLSLKQWALAYWENVPSNAILEGDDGGSTDSKAQAANLVTGGAFGCSDINNRLFNTAGDGVFAYSDGQVRDFTTYFNTQYRNFYYRWFSKKSDLTGYKDIKDTLFIRNFTDFNLEYINIESSPKNYLEVNGVFINSDLVLDYKALVIRLDGAFALRQKKSILITFEAKNLDLNLAQNIQITFTWQEVVDDTVIDSGTFSNSPILPSGTWNKYNTILQRPNADVGEIINPTSESYTEIHLRLPTGFSFRLGITNVFASYNTTLSIYPRDAECVGFAPLTEKTALERVAYTMVGEITARLDSKDTINTIKADGRIIYADSVHNYAYTDNDGNIIESMPQYQTSLKTLYNYVCDIGYPNGNGDDYVTYSDITTGVYSEAGIALAADAILEWNKPSFNPKFTVSSGSESAITFTEFHRGMDLDPYLWYKTFKPYSTDNTSTSVASDTIIACNTDNYLKALVANGGQIKLFDDTFADPPNTLPEILYKDNPQARRYMWTPEQVQSFIGNRNYCGFNLQNTRGLTFFHSPTLFCHSIGILSYQFLSRQYTDSNYNKHWTFDNDASSAGNVANHTIAIMDIDARTPDGVDSTSQSYILPYMFRLKQYPTPTALPTTNPTLNIVPNTWSNSFITFDKQFISSTQSYLPYYPVSQAYDILASLSAFELMSPTIIRQAKGYVVQLHSENFIDYKNIYFTVECDAKRDYQVKKFSLGKSKYETKSTDDKKFCFYFFTGSENPPTAIGNDYNFIPIVITGTQNKVGISKVIEKTINTYRVAVPNLQNTILKADGLSDFDVPDNPVEFAGGRRAKLMPAIYCKNLRNIGYQRSKAHITNKLYTSHIDYDTMRPMLSYREYNAESTPYHESIVSFHISIGG